MAAWLQEKQSGDRQSTGVKKRSEERFTIMGGRGSGSGGSKKNGLSLKNTLKNYLEEYAKERTEYGRADNYKVAMTDWANYGKDRTYLKVIETNNNSKHYVEQNYGYIDNLTNEYVPGKYGDIRREHERIKAGRHYK